MASATLRVILKAAAALFCSASAIWGQSRPVAAHDLARGVVLSANDIQWIAAPHEATAKGDPAIARATPSGTDSVAIGWVTRRPVRAGEVLAPPTIARPDVVATGDLVQLTYTNDQVTIRIQGTAVGSGSVGDRIYVRLDNRRRLHGVITGPHSVEVVL